MKKIILSIYIILIYGCAATGENLRANSYNSSQLNKNQAVTAVNIISIMPAKINIDNSKQKQQAQVGIGMFGAIIGGVAGAYLGNGAGAAIGTLSGGAIGAAGGSLVSDTVLVNGVTLAYNIKKELKSSTQVGLLCEYKLGTAIMVKTDANNTRIQPNNTCPKK